MPDELPDTPLEHVAGAIPADPAAADAARTAFYTRLAAAAGNPTCRPEAGAHAFPPDQRTGPCLCGNVADPKEKPR